MIETHMRNIMNLYNSMLQDNIDELNKTTTKSATPY